MRKEHLTVRVSPETQDRIRDRAKKEGLNEARTLRSLILAGLWVYDIIERYHDNAETP